MFITNLLKSFAVILAVELGQGIGANQGKGVRLGDLIP